MQGRQALLARYLRATIALVLVLSSTMASYGHAACPPAKTGAHEHRAHVIVVKAPVEHHEASQNHDEPNDSGKGHAFCMDGVCHGWHAVLAKSATLSAPAGVVADAAITIIRLDPRSSSLERPPRTPVLAWSKETCVSH